MEQGATHDDATGKVQYTAMSLQKVSESNNGMTTAEFNASTHSIKLDLDKQEINEKTALKKSKNEASWKHLQIFGAEVFGTSFLMFFGCLSCVSVNGASTDFPSAITFGFTVASIIGIFGHISAAHLNPSVTITFYLMDRISPIAVAVYLIAEFIGAILGMGAAVMLSPEMWIASSPLCVTKPDDLLTTPQAFAIEFLCTFALCLVVCGLNDSRTPQGDSGSLKFAGVIIALSLAAGKSTGASMNPARSFAPAVWTGVWTKHWIYWMAPLTASVAAPVVYKLFWAEKKPTDETEAMKK